MGGEGKEKQQLDLHGVCVEKQALTQSQFPNKNVDWEIMGWDEERSRICVHHKGLAALKRRQRCTDLQRKEAVTHRTTV